MIITFFGFFLLSSVEGCLWEMTPPCSCRSIGFRTSEVKCTNANNVETLRKSLLGIQDQPILTLYVMDSSLVYLPSELFMGLRIEKVWLDNSTFRDLADSEFAFEGLEKTLERLVIQDCVIFNGFNWHEFRKLDSLTSLVTVKAGLQAVDSDIGEIAHLPLDSLELTQDSISYIDNNAFSLFENLRVLSLKRNFIKDVERSMLPNSATKLNVINLSYNKIERLPYDIFTNMPSLIFIILAGNKLITVDQAAFTPVWSRLNKIDLYENPLRCDCRLEWLQLEKFPKNTWAVCASPPILNGTNLKNLRGEELYC